LIGYYEGLEDEGLSCDSDSVGGGWTGVADFNACEGACFESGVGPETHRKILDLFRWRSLGIAFGGAFYEE
jgi:hypothetical protein